MTRFGKYPGVVLFGLRGTAARGAVAEAGLGVRAVSFLAAGDVIGGLGTFGERLLAQIGQSGVPVLNVANACATGAVASRAAVMAIRAGESDAAMAVGAAQISGPGLLAGRDRPPDHERWVPEGRMGAVMEPDGRAGVVTMPGVGGAGARQTDGARFGPAHMIGLGSAHAVHIFERSA